MKADSSSLGPWQFTTWYLLGLTALVAVACSVGVTFGWGWTVLLLVSAPVVWLLWHPGRRDAGCVVLAVAFTGSLLLSVSMHESYPAWVPCHRNLSFIRMGLLQYHDRHGCFPPPYIEDDQGQPLYSWRVLLLPYVEDQKIYQQWHFDQPWNSPHNRPLADQVVDIYRCPASPQSNQPLTDYLAVVGQGMAWEQGKSLTLDDFADGLDQTIMLVEVEGSRVHWAEPVDLDRATMSLQINGPPGRAIGSLHEMKSRWSSQPGANAGFADGAVIFLPERLKPGEVEAMLTRDGGEQVDRERLR